MTSEQMLQDTAGIIAERGAAYGDVTASMSAIAERWSFTLGHAVTPAQVTVTKAPAAADKPLVSRTSGGRHGGDDGEHESDDD